MGAVPGLIFELSRLYVQSMAEGDNSKSLKVIARAACLALITWFGAPPPLAAQVSQSADQEPIVVIGERVPRTPLESSSSLVVITDEGIEGAAADRLDQLLTMVPNVQLGSGTEGPSIRGQDSTGLLRDVSAFLGGTRPRVTLQVDGRAMGYYEYVFGTASTWDVAQIEIYRSPQTTTQGRNSIAGAIFIETADPSYAWEGRARLIGGNYGILQGSSVVSGPIVADQLAFRLSGDIRTMRTSSHMADGIAGAGLKRDRFGVLRAKFLAEPQALPDFRLEMTYVHAESQAPQFEAVAPPFRARQIETLERSNGVYRVNADSLTAIASYQADPSLSVRTTVSLGDGAITRFGLPALGEAQIASSDLSGETVVNWKPGASLRVLGGVHGIRARLRQTIDVSGPGLRFGMGKFADLQTSFGLFGETTWRPLEELAVTAGLRYQRDRQDRHGQLTPTGSPIPLDFDHTFDAWLPKLSIAYDVGDGLTMGVLLQRAFNPGGTTISLRTRSAHEFAAEKLWNYEAFLRSSFAGGRGTITANLFYNDITDAQRFTRILLDDGLPSPLSEVGNAPKAESYGFEAELGWRAGNRFSARLGLGLLKTKLLRTQLPEDPILGREFERAPRLSAAASVDWGPVEKLRLSAQARANSGYFSNDENTPALRIAGSTVVNVRAAYRHGPLTIFGYARNLLDAFYLTYLFPSPFGGPPTLGVAGDPREFGLGVEARF